MNTMLSRQWMRIGILVVITLAIGFVVTFLSVEFSQHWSKAAVAHAQVTQSFYVSNVSGAGMSMGGNNNSGTLQAPFLTLQQALSAAPAGSAIYVCGSFSPASSTDYMITLPVTIQAYRTGCATFTPAAGQASLFEFAQQGGSTSTLRDLILNTSNTATNAVKIDNENGLQTVDLVEDTLTGGSGSNVVNAPNASFNLNIDDGSETGSTVGIGTTAYASGIYLNQVSSGAVYIIGFQSSMTPRDGSVGHVTDLYVDGNGAGASASNPVSVTADFSINSTLPTSSAGQVNIGIFLINVNLRLTGGTYIMNSQPGNLTTTCRPIEVETDVTNPIPTTITRLEYYTDENNCAGGGAAGPVVGTDGWPSSAQFTGSQSGTSLTISSLPAGESILPGMTIAFGLATGTIETVSSGTCTTSSCTLTMSTPQSIPSETMYAGVPNMISNAVIAYGTSYGGPLNANLPNAGIIEGAAFCGWETGLKMYKNVGYNLSFDYNVKDCTNTVVDSNIGFDATKDAFVDKGSNHTVWENNTYIDTSFAGISYGLDLEQDNANYIVGYQYARNGVFENNVFDILAPNSELRNVGMANLCWSGTCLNPTTPSPKNSYTFISNDYYRASGYPIPKGAGYAWTWDNGKTGGSYYNTLAAWIAAGHETSASTAAPQLASTTQQMLSEYRSKEAVVQ
jgi:hypothetical protein